MKSKIMYIIYNFIFNFICVYTVMFFIMIVASLVGSFTFLVPEYSYNFIKAFHAIRFWETLKFSAYRHNTRSGYFDFVYADY